MLCRGFGIKWENRDILDAAEGLPKGKVSRSIRLLEAELASSLQIPFDMSYYGILVKVREQMIAARMIDDLVNSLYAYAQSR